jgi:hypothetical protein
MMIAILTVGITYVLTGVAFSFSRYQSGRLAGIPEWAQLAAPIVTTGLFGFIVINNAVAWIRVRLLLRLEYLLGINPDKADMHKWGSSLPSFRTTAGVVLSPKPKGIELIYFITMIANYGTTCIIAFGFTVFCLALGPWDGWKTIALVFYVIIHSIEVAGLLLPQFYYRFKE